MPLPRYTDFKPIVEQLEQLEIESLILDSLEENKKLREEIEELKKEMKIVKQRISIYNAPRKRYL